MNYSASALANMQDDVLDLSNHIHSVVEGQEVHSFLISEGLAEVVKGAAYQAHLDSELTYYENLKPISWPRRYRQHGGGSKR